MPRARHFKPRTWRWLPTRQEVKALSLATGLKPLTVITLPVYNTANGSWDRPVWSRRWKVRSIADHGEFDGDRTGFCVLRNYTSYGLLFAIHDGCSLERERNAQKRLTHARDFHEEYVKSSSASPRFPVRSRLLYIVRMNKQINADTQARRAERRVKCGTERARAKFSPNYLLCFY